MLQKDDEVVRGCYNAGRGPALASCHKARWPQQGGHGVAAQPQSGPPGVGHRDSAAIRKGWRFETSLKCSGFLLEWVVESNEIGQVPWQRFHWIKLPFLEGPELWGKLKSLGHPDLWGQAPPIGVPPEPRIARRGHRHLLVVALLSGGLWPTSRSKANQDLWLDARLYVMCVYVIMCEEVQKCILPY